MKRLSSEERFVSESEVKVEHFDDDDNNNEGDHPIGTRRNSKKYLETEVAAEGDFGGDLNESEDDGDIVSHIYPAEDAKSTISCEENISHIYPAEDAKSTISCEENISHIYPAGDTKCTISCEENPCQTCLGLTVIPLFLFFYLIVSAYFLGYNSMMIIIKPEEILSTITASSNVFTYYCEGDLELNCYNNLMGGFKIFSGFDYRNCSCEKAQCFPENSPYCAHPNETTCLEYSTELQCGSNCSCYGKSGTEAHPQSDLDFDSIGIGITYFLTASLILVELLTLLLSGFCLFCGIILLLFFLSKMILLCMMLTDPNCNQKGTIETLKYLQKYFFFGLKSASFFFMLNIYELYESSVYCTNPMEVIKAEVLENDKIELVCSKEFCGPSNSTFCVFENYNYCIDRVAEGLEYEGMTCLSIEHLRKPDKKIDYLIMGYCIFGLYAFLKLLEGCYCKKNIKKWCYSVKKENHIEYMYMDNW